MKLEKIQSKIIELSKVNGYVTTLDLTHLGSQATVDRARRALRESGKLITVGFLAIGNNRYAKMTAAEEKPKKALKWPCGTPKSTGNVFDWRGKPQTLTNSDYAASRAIFTMAKK